jgi:hypothetical protein
LLHLKVLSRNAGRHDLAYLSHVRTTMTAALSDPQDNIATRVRGRATRFSSSGPTQTKHRVPVSCICRYFSDRVFFQIATPEVLHEEPKIQRGDGQKSQMRAAGKT